MVLGDQRSARRDGAAGQPGYRHLEPDTPAPDIPAALAGRRRGGRVRLSDHRYGALAARPDAARRTGDALVLLLGRPGHARQPPSDAQSGYRTGATARRRLLLAAGQSLSR